jgi:hypothetical protein
MFIFMDKRTRYCKIVEILSGYEVTDEVPLSTLRRLIIMNIGSSERVITDCLRLMINYGLIIEVDNGIYKIKNKEYC